MTRLLEVENLETRFKVRSGYLYAVNGVSLSLEKGEMLGVVGESGCGKSVSMLSLVKLLPPAAQVTGGRVLLEGIEITHAGTREMNRIRGTRIGMIFQDPMTSLNPYMKIGKQLCEGLVCHKGISMADAMRKAATYLDLVGISNSRQRLQDYPHQLSGGMRQRVMIAMALLIEPSMVIADEPTTALDVTIQAQIVELVKDLRAKLKTSIIWITHDLSLLAGLVDRIMVMYAGSVIEEAPLDDIYRDPRHPYTIGLLRSIPSLKSAMRGRLASIGGAPPNLSVKPTGCPFAPRCTYKMARCLSDVPSLEPASGAGSGHRIACFVDVRSRGATQMTTGEEKRALMRVTHLVKDFPIKLGAFGEKNAVIHAVNDISFDIYRGETLGLVGESGCGKSTTGFTLLQLYRPTAGSVEYDGRDLATLKARELRAIRKKIQIVFQDPYSTLNPRMTIGEALAEPIKVHGLARNKDVSRRAAQLISDVGLDPKVANRYPHEFSGGQRQRICIARALASEPDFIVCDEPISALDVSIRAQIINLLMDIQQKYRLTYLFIAHDLAVVRHISDRVAVMYLGRIVEIAGKEELFGNPLHPYTTALLSAVPEADPDVERNRKRIILKGDVSDAIDPPSGCSFHPRVVLRLWNAV